MASEKIRNYWWYYQEIVRMEPSYSDVTNVTGVAAYLRVAPATVYRLAQQGKIPCGKVGRAWRFRKEAIDRWILEHPGGINDPSEEHGEIA